MLIEKLQKEAQENMQLLSDASDVIEEKSGAIFEAYRDALATFEAEPEPLVKSGGPEVSGLLDWMLKEFAVLGNILTYFRQLGSYLVRECFRVAQARRLPRLGQDCRSRVSVPVVFRVGSLHWQDSICEKGFLAKVLVICWPASCAGYRSPAS